MPITIKRRYRKWLYIGAASVGGVLLSASLLFPSALASVLSQADVMSDAITRISSLITAATGIAALIHLSDDDESKSKPRRRAKKTSAPDPEPEPPEALNA